MKIKPISAYFFKFSFYAAFEDFLFFHNLSKKFFIFFTFCYLENWKETPYHPPKEDLLEYSMYLCIRTANVFVGMVGITVLDTPSIISLVNVAISELLKPPIK